MDKRFRFAYFIREDIIWIKMERRFSKLTNYPINQPKGGLCDPLVLLGCLTQAQFETILRWVSDMMVLYQENQEDSNE